MKTLMTFAVGAGFMFWLFSFAIPAFTAPSWDIAMLFVVLGVSLVVGLWVVCDVLFGGGERG